MVAEPRERLATLEEWRRKTESDLLKMSQKVDEMHGILLQAKGARWAILAAAGFAGFLSGMLTTFAAWWHR